MFPLFHVSTLPMLSDWVRTGVTRLCVHLFLRNVVLLTK